MMIIQINGVKMEAWETEGFKYFPKNPCVSESLQRTMYSRFRLDAESKDLQRLIPFSRRSDDRVEKPVEPLP